MALWTVTKTALFLPVAASREQNWLPSADVYRSQLGWLIKLDLAGVQQSDVNVELSGTKLMISGCRRDWLVNEDWSPYSMEISYCRFERVIELPFPEKRTKINAELRDGMMLIYVMLEGEE